MSTIKTGTTLTTAYQVVGDTTGALVIQTGATPTTAMTITSSQQVGIGTASPSAPLAIGRVNSAEEGGQIDLCRASDNASSWGIDVFGSTSTPSLRFVDNVASATRMAIDGSGNVGIGTSSPAQKLVVSGSGAQRFDLIDTGGAAARMSTSSGVAYVGTTTNHPLVLFTNDAEKMRIDSSGNLLVGTTSGTTSTFYRTDNSLPSLLMRNGSASGTIFGATVNFSAQAPNNTTSFFLQCNDTGAERATIRSNGGLANYSANNVNLSDERTKTDIIDAGSYLDKICAIPVRTFKYKDQTDDLLNLGVIAQEVEAVAPELVDVTGYGDTPEDGVPLKAIYQTDLQYALMKCIQEQQAIITTLTERITALENK